MEKQIDTGGPAFPCEWGKVLHTPGMTLRDYFAAKAMQAFLNEAGWKADQKWFAEIAEGAYKMASAMLQAREQ